MSARRHPCVHSYGDGEFMLSYGTMDAPQFLVLQPLFEEMNRCRAFVAALCRTLAGAGFGCWLPDLPGTGESPHPLDDIAWDDWVAAIREAAGLILRKSGRMPRLLGLRGGALLDGSVEALRWRLAPTSGRSLLSDLRRSALAGDGDRAAPAGYRLDPALVDALVQADVPAIATARTLRLSSDSRSAHKHIDGPSLWRRPEPVGDAALVRLVADDIAAWGRL